MADFTKNPTPNFHHRVAELMKQKRWDEASAALEVLLDEAEKNISRLDVADAYITLVSVHMEMQNQIQQEYLDALDAAIFMVKSMDAGGHKLNDQIDLARLNHQIGELGSKW